MKILLGVTGSVASIKTPTLYEALRQANHEVRIVATRAATYFFDPVQIEPIAGGERNRAVVHLDEDEWPGRDSGRRYERDDEVLHIELRRWAEAMVIAPLDANTLAKLAGGLADNCLTCVYRAWDLARPIILAPAMNTLMWEHPMTKRHLRQLAEDTGLQVPGGLALDELIDWMNAHGQRLRIISPQSRKLACGDVGVGAMADVERIVSALPPIAPIPEVPSEPRPLGSGGVPAP